MARAVLEAESMSVLFADFGRGLPEPRQLRFFIDPFFTGSKWKQGKNHGPRRSRAEAVRAIGSLHPAEYPERSRPGGMENDMKCMENPPIRAFGP